MMPTSSLILTALTSAAVLVLGLFLLARPDHSTLPGVQLAAGCETMRVDDEVDDISSCTVDSCGGTKNLELYNKVLCSMLLLGVHF